MRKEIVDYPGYTVDNSGKIYKEDKELNYFDNQRGYLSVFLSGGGKNTPFRVHRLVALAFIPNPNNLPVVNHKDGNKYNNSVENLEWVSYKRNTEHSLAMGKREKKSVVRINPKNGTVKGVYLSIRQASNELGLNYRSLFEAVKKGNKYKGYIYKYCTLNIVADDINVSL